MATETNINTESLIRHRLDKLLRFRQTIKSSQLFQETIDLIPTNSISKIRCLALGSPITSNASLYQFGYLLELMDHLKVEASLYDPIFNDNDSEIFHHFNDITVIDLEHSSPSLTLYFLPHADLSVTNDLIKTYKPCYLLGNDLTSHTGRLSKQKLHDNYQMLSLLVHLVDSQHPHQQPSPSDEFTPVVKSKNKRRNKKFVPAQITYDYSSCYFKSIQLTRLNHINGPWANAFTDLAFHFIT